MNIRYYLLICTSIFSLLLITNCSSEEEKLDVSSFINTPFTLSVPGSDEWATEENIIPNESNPGETDTIQTFSFKNSTIQAKNHVTVDAKLNDKEILLANNISIGMSRQEFENKFDDLHDNKDDPYIKLTDDEVIMGCCMKDNFETGLWHFQFKDELLSSVVYEKNE